MMETGKTQNILEISKKCCGVFFLTINKSYLKNKISKFEISVTIQVEIWVPAKYNTV